MDNLSPRKAVNGKTVYLPRQFKFAKVIGKPLLWDFGSAVRDEAKNHFFAQPEIFRSPEVVLEMEWRYPIDIWNLGVLVGLHLHLRIIANQCIWR